MLSPPPIQFAERDGCHLAFQVAGAGPIELIYVGGAASLTHSWEEAAYARGLRRMASFARLVTYDQRGMGFSDPIEGSSVPTMDDLVADLGAVIGAAGVSRPVLFGHHNGGAVAAAYAATHPVERLIICNSWARLSVDDDYPIGFDDRILDRLEERYRTEWGTGRISDTYAQPRPDVQTDRLELASTSRNQAVTLFRINRDYDIRDALPTITAPTLVLHTEHNFSIPAIFGRYMAEAIPAARLVLVPGSDQIILRNDPDAIIDEVELFITGTLSPFWDHMVTTMLVTDIVESTPMAAALGHAGWSEVMEEHNLRMHRLIKRFGGHQVKSTGDGFLAAFDDPASAVQCALAACSTMGDLDLRLRAGVHVGEVSRMGNNDLSGLAVHFAQRLCDRAHDGQVLVSSELVAACADSQLEFDDRTADDFDDIPSELRIFEATPIDVPGLSPA